MFEIIEGIPKPENIPPKAGSSKYPLPEMKIGQSYVVPFSEMNKGETPEKFRNRIYQSARNYALRDYNQRTSQWESTKSEANAGLAPAKKEFTAALMTEDDKQSPMRWAKGDVVVWRDK